MCLAVAITNCHPDFFEFPLPSNDLLYIKKKWIYVYNFTRHISKQFKIYSWMGSTKTAIMIEARIANPRKMYIKKRIWSVGGLLRTGPLISLSFDNDSLRPLGQKFAPQKSKRSSLICVLLWVPSWDNTEQTMVLNVQILWYLIYLKLFPTKEFTQLFVWRFSSFGNFTQLLPNDTLSYCVARFCLSVTVYCFGFYLRKRWYCPKWTMFEMP